MLKQKPCEYDHTCVLDNPDQLQLCIEMVLEWDCNAITTELYALLQTTCMAAYKREVFVGY